MISKLISMLKTNPIKKAEKVITSLDTMLHTFDKGVQKCEEGILAYHVQIADLYKAQDALLEKEHRLLIFKDKLERLLD